MIKATVQGIIGDGGMKPTITWDWQDRMNPKTGKTESTRVPFIRFQMLCEDTTKRAVFNPTTGREQRPREIVQVILPENDRGLKIFKTLAPGRIVQIEGRMTFRPNTGTDSNGNAVSYANPKIYMSELTYLDSPVEKQVDRLVAIMKDCKVEVNNSTIDDQMGDVIKTSILSYLASKREHYGEPHKIVDNTTNNDPNSPDFNS